MRRTLLTTIAATAAATVLLASAPLATAAKGGGPGYDYYSYGNVAGDVKTTMQGGLLMSGGGIDDPRPCLAARPRRQRRRRRRGRPRRLRPGHLRGSVHGLGRQLGRAFVFSKREGAYDRKVLDAIAQAEVIWLDGGDQSNYVNLVGRHPAAGGRQRPRRPGAAFGGMSAGLAVQGGWVYSAMNGSATSSNVLANPYDKDVTLRGALFALPFMANTITDTHFAVRDRMGRLLGFLARLEKDLGPRRRGRSPSTRTPRSASTPGPATCGCSATGGQGAWLVRTDGVTSRTVEPKTALTYGPVSVTRMTTGDTFNLKRWSGQGTETYPVSATSGVLSPASPY